MEIIELYSYHIAVHLNASKERLLEENKKKYELEDMPTARVTRPQATPNSAVPPHAQPAPSETLESGTGNFSTRETPHLRQPTTPPWPLP